MFQEFKKFAMRGNVMDMAIGIILGAAFGKIVQSFVKDVVMPPIGMAIGGVDFADLKIVLKEGVAAAAELKDAAGNVITPAVAEIPEVAVRYGAWLNTVIDFLIVAFVIFMVVRTLNRLKKAEPEPDPTEKACAFCCSTIAIQATRCPHCTSQLDASA